MQTAELSFCHAGLTQAAGGQGQHHDSQGKGKKFRATPHNSPQNGKDNRKGGKY